MYCWLTLVSSFLCDVTLILKVMLCPCISNTSSLKLKIPHSLCWALLVQFMSFWNVQTLVAADFMVTRVVWRVLTNSYPVRCSDQDYQQTICEQIIPSICLQKNHIQLTRCDENLNTPQWHQSRTCTAVRQLNVNTDESPRHHRTPAPRPETPTPLPGAVERARRNPCQSRHETLRYFNSQDLIFNNFDAYFITANVSFTFPYSYSPA